MANKLKVFTGNANPSLAQEVCVELNIPLGQAEVSRFTDGEISARIGENVRGTDVFIIQSTFPPADNILELLLMIDAALRASARRITAVIPYFGYARKDRKDEPRVPISSKLVANLISTAGADRVLTIDLHAEQIMGFFDIPVDQLYATPVIIDHIQRMKISNLMVVSPDPGALVRSRAFAKKLGNLSLAIIDKRRPRADQAVVMNVVGDVSDTNVIIIDDILNTGGTVINAAEALKQHGALDVYVSCTHPVLPGNAPDTLQASAIKEIMVTNTIPVPREKQIPKLTVLSIAPLLADAIRRIHNEQSVSVLFT
jgi:ribose-phosphate pyrophosphokinase